MKSLSGGNLCKRTRPLCSTLSNRIGKTKSGNCIKKHSSQSRENEYVPSAVFHKTKVN